MWTKHRLNEASLQLHYGLEFKAEISRNTIITARQVRERVALPLARYEAEKERIFAAFSDQGQVLLVLDQPYPFRVGLFGSSKFANQLLINVDQRDEFLADLDLQAASTVRGDASVPTPLPATPAPTRVGNLKFDSYSDQAIHTQHLTRRYKGFIAVDDLNLSVHRGEIYGFLGSNGAGKTTTMKMLVGLLKPDLGHAWIDGHDVWHEPLEAKSTFGYVAGPFAGFTGKLYEEAFYEMEGRSQSRTVIKILGVRLLSKLLRRYRTLTNALLVKGLLNQSRNVFTCGRVVIILVCLALFAMIRTLLTPFGFSRMLLEVVYASAVAILAVIDYAPYTISSEGSRLIYYLVAQTGIKTYLRSRSMVLLIAALVVGLTISLVMSWWIGLSIPELAQVVIMVSLIVIAYTSFYVCGSAWDEDLNLVSEGMMPVISQEELPFTPRRLQLLGLSFLLLGAMFLLVWKLPMSLSMPVLMLLDAIMLILGWHFSYAQIQGLINRG